MNTDPASDQACSPFHAARRRAATPTAVLAQALGAARLRPTRALPGNGSFDPSTAAALLARLDP